jgi:NEDD8-activating enzyme E1
MIQKFNADFYKQFHVIIAGLDNIEARRWLNSMVHSLVEFDEEGNIVEGTQIPMIDGGTEGFKGQARVINPYKTGCFECSLGSLPPQTGFPMCTIRETPRLPEHCIQYAYVLSWEEAFPGKAVDKDSPVDMKWIYEKALERADRFGIQGVTYQLTMGVVKNIIPAIASTNALVSAACVTEAIKLLSGCNHHLNNYLMYMGQSGVSTQTFEYGREETCFVCKKDKKSIDIESTATLGQLLEALKEKFRFQKPSLTHNLDPIYISNPETIEINHRHKLDKTIKELIEMGVMMPARTTEYELFDKSVVTVVKLNVTLTDVAV